MNRRRFAGVVQAVYCEPWLIRPEMHAKIQEILTAHINGTAHQAGGIAALWPDPPKDADANAKPDPLYRVEDGLGIIEIAGVIGKRIGALERSSGVMDIEDSSKALRAAMKDEEVEGLILALDTPGGQIQGVPEFAASVREARESKPIVAWTDTQAASSGYWIASSASAIVATPSAVVGCIGVYLPVLDESRRYESAGIKQEVFKGGRFKGAGIPGTSLTEEQRAQLQARVDDRHALFRNEVRRGRGRRIEDEHMEGQEFFARSALAIGLVDALGDFGEAARIARGLIDGGKNRL